MSTITKEFTKEQLIEKLKHRISVASVSTESEKAQIDLEIARIALASLEAKSRKLFTCSWCGTEGLDEPLESKFHCNEDGAHWVESVVYTAPPAQVVPAALPENDNEDGHDIDYLEPSEVYALGRTAGWNACRAAMLQGAEHVTDNTNQQFESLAKSK